MHAQTANSGTDVWSPCGAGALQGVEKREAAGRAYVGQCETGKCLRVETRVTGWKLELFGVWGEIGDRTVTI